MANETAQGADDLTPGDIASLRDKRKVRVLRIIEYIYDSGELASEDMNRWGVPAQGRKSPDFREGITIRSGILIAPFDVDLDSDGAAGYVARALITSDWRQRGPLESIGVEVGKIGFDTPQKPYSQQKAEAELSGELPEDAQRISAEDA